MLSTESNQTELVQKDSAPRPLRVAYLISAVHTEAAGTEGHLLRLMRQCDRGELDPLLITLQDTAWSEAFDDTLIPLKSLGFRSFARPSSWLCIRKLKRLLQRNRVDLLEMHSSDAHFVGSLAARWAGIPAISCRRDLGHQLGPKQRMLHRLGNPLVRHFVANSEAVVQRFASLEGIRPELFSVVYNGINLSEFDAEAVTPLPQPWRQLASEHRLITLAANLRPVKNHAMLIDAALTIVDRYPDVRFLMLGSGPLLDDLQHRCRQVGFSDYFVWAGSQDCVAPFLRASSIGVLTSNSEGFSNAILEYMAAGLPVVATRVGGAAEAIEHGKTGWLVDRQDGHTLTQRILELLASPAEAAGMGRAGRLRVEQRFTMQRQLESFYALYRSICSR